MSDEELVKRLVDWSEHDEGKINDARQEAADRIEALIEARDTMGHLWAKEAAEKQVALGRIEELTVEREKDHANINLKADFIEKTLNQLAEAEAKLAKAVSWFETIRDRAKGDYMANTYYLDALAALATIEGSDAP